MLETLLISLLKSRRRLVLQASLLAVFVSFMEVAAAALAMPLLLILSKNQTPSALNSSRVLQYLSGLYTVFPPQQQLLAVVCIILFVTVIKNICLYLSHININKLQLQVGNDVRRKCVEKLLSSGLQFHSQSKPGELLSYTNEHSERIARLSSYVLESVLDTLVICLLLVLLISISPLLTFVTLASLTLIFLVVQRTVRSVQDYGQKAASLIDENSALIAEMIGGIRVVKSFDAEAREQQRIERSLQSRYDAELGAYRHLSAVNPVTETAGIVVLLILIVAGLHLLGGTQSATLPLLLTFTIALMRLLPRVTHLNNMRSQFSLLSGSVQSVQNFLNSEVGQHIEDGLGKFRGLQSELSFENVSFTFAANTEPTLHNVSFTLKKGTVTALVGPSGGGKSTIADLAMRFYEPDSGRITIDGKDIKEFNLSSLRQSFAMVSQDTFLFNATLRENIAYGFPEATEEQIMDAARRAHAYEFIEKLPEGLDTIVGNRGLKLSGGQRQRIAIARAILRNPEILVLDEATSALDSKSERILQKAIEEVSKDRTVLVIAHRLSTIEHSDNIVIISDGCVVEQGTHDELLLNLGEYSTLYRSQLIPNGTSRIPSALASKI